MRSKTCASGRNRRQSPKSEIRNPKSETNSNEPRSKSSKPSRRRRAVWSGFENLSFEFGVCFGFRVSDFGFVLAVQRCPAEKMWDMLRLRGGGEAPAAREDLRVSCVPLIVSLSI